VVTTEDADEFISTTGTVASHLATAKVLVDDYVGDVDVPQEVLDNAYLQLAQELQLRQRSPGGVSSFAGAEVPTRVARDAMTSIYPLLDHYVCGIA
jgi:hypothetical protein